MNRSRFSDSQIMEALNRADAGVKVPDRCRELGILRKSSRPRSSRRHLKKMVRPAPRRETTKSEAVRC